MTATIETADLDTIRAAALHFGTPEMGRALCRVVLALADAAPIDAIADLRGALEAVTAERDRLSDLLATSRVARTKDAERIAALEEAATNARQWIACGEPAIAAERLNPIESAVTPAPATAPNCPVCRMASAIDPGEAWCRDCESAFLSAGLDGSSPQDVAAWAADRARLAPPPVLTRAMLADAYATACLGAGSADALIDGTMKALGAATLPPLDLASIRRLGDAVLAVTGFAVDDGQWRDVLARLAPVTLPVAPEKPARCAACGKDTGAAVTGGPGMLRVPCCGVGTVCHARAHGAIDVLHGYDEVSPATAAAMRVDPVAGAGKWLDDETDAILGWAKCAIKDDPNAHANEEKRDAACATIDKLCARLYEADQLAAMARDEGVPDECPFDGPPSNPELFGWGVVDNDGHRRAYVDSGDVTAEKQATRSATAFVGEAFPLYTRPPAPVAHVPVQALREIASKILAARTALREDMFVSLTAIADLAAAAESAAPVAAPVMTVGDALDRRVIEFHDGADWWQMTRDGASCRLWDGRRPVDGVGGKWGEWHDEPTSTSDLPRLARLVAVDAADDPPESRGPIVRAVLGAKPDGAR